MIFIPDEKGFIPFKDKEELFKNGIKEVTNSLEQVMEHYAFLQDGDFETGRAEQFQPRNIDALVNIQEEITRWSWIRTKFSQWNSDEMIIFWKRHRQEYEILKQLSEEYIKVSYNSNKKGH